MDLTGIISVLLEHDNTFTFYQYYCDRVGTVNYNRLVEQLTNYGNYNARSNGAMHSLLQDVLVPLRARYSQLWDNTRHTKEYIDALLESALFISMLITDSTITTSIDLYVFGEKRPAVKYLSINGSTTLLTKRNYATDSLQHTLLLGEAIVGFWRAVPSGEYLLGKPAIWVVQHPALVNC